ncbi:unnamed protein product [Cuscuta campestris]|uniref:GPI-anchored protein LLG1-like domain-containing protein n=1 Tax=Cuscuta campestris TaxID=132261 RepID=A0A484JZ64_9ASTE|nr:unnamed protein product [Cuscuta campestris]
MGRTRMPISCCIPLLLLLSSLIIPSGSHSSSGDDEDEDGVLDSKQQEASMGKRRLLQAKKNCPVDMEIQNYTAITGQCKGPKYAVQQCCDAFLTVACPLSEYLNDLTTDCASNMFSYINLLGHYSPGLISSFCKGDKVGLPCPAGNGGSAPAPTPGPADDHGGAATSPPALCLVPFLLFWMLFFSF